MNAAELEQDLKQQLGAFPQLRLVILFGSLAQDSADAQSDIDLAVLADKELDSHDKMALIGALAERFGRPVDLIDLRCTGEPLLGEILKGRRILGESDLHARLITQHLVNAADFIPLQQRILKERRDAWINS